MKKHGCIWWVLIGWWWVLLTLPFRIPAAIIKCMKSRPSEGEPTPARTETRAEPPKPMKPPESPKPTQVSGKEETHKVAGTSFRQDAIKSLGVKNPDFAKTKKTLQDEGLTDDWIYEYDFAPAKVELIPEPDNPHDPKAIKVVVDSVHIGYIKAGSCAHVHKLLAADRILRISCFISGGKNKGLFWDDDENRYSMEGDTIPFYARLTITAKPED